MWVFCTKMWKSRGGKKKLGKKLINIKFASILARKTIKILRKRSRLRDGYIFPLTTPVHAEKMAPGPENSDFFGSVKISLF